MEAFQRWVRATVLADLSYAATVVTLLALCLHYAGHMAPAAMCGTVGAVLVALKYRAKRRAAKARS